MTEAPVVPRKSRWKTWRRRLLRGLGGILTLVIVAIAAVLVLVHTDYGREQVRSVLETELDALFVGDVKIERIEGSLLSEFSIVGISITDGQQLPAVSVARVDIGYAPLSLWNKTIDIETLVVRGLEVQARRDQDGVLNLAQLLEEQEPRTEPLAWRILAPTIQLRDSAASLTEPTGQTRLDTIDLDAAVTFENDELTASVARFGAVLQLPAQAERSTEPASLPVALRASLRAGSEGLAVDSARLDLGAASAEVATLLLGSDGHTLADVSLFVPAELVQLLDPGTGLLADTTLVVHAERASSTAPVDFRVTGQLGASPLSLQGTFSPDASAATLHMEAHALDASALWAGLTPSLVDLTIDGETTGFDPEQLRANATLLVSGQVDGTQLGALKLHANLADGVADGSITAVEGPKWIDARGRFKLATQEIEKSELNLDHPRIQALTANYVDVRGDLKLHATASGTLDSLHVDGTLASQRFSGFGNRTRGLRAEWSGQVGGGQYAGKVKASASALNASGTEVGAVALEVQSERTNHFRVHLLNRGPQRAHLVDLHSDVILGQRDTEVDIRTILIATHGLRWRGKGGRVVIGKNDDLQFDKIALDSDAGHIRVDGQVQLGAGQPSGDLELTARDMDLAVLGALVSPELALEGLATLRATLHKPRGKKARASVQLALQDVRSGTELPATTGTIEFALDRRDITFDAALAAQGVGTVTVHAHGLGPRNPLAVPAWKRLDESALVSASIETSALDISSVSQLGENLPTSGRVTIKGTLEAGAAEGELLIQVRDLLHPRIAEAANSDLRVTLAGPALHASMEATIENRVRAIADATALLPGPLLRPTTLAALDQNVLQEATVKIDDVDLFWWDEVLGLGLEPTNSRAEVDLVIARAAQSATLTVRAEQDATDADGKPQKRSSELVADVTASDTSVSIHGSLGREEAARGTIRVGAGWNLLLAGDATALANAPVQADLAIVKLPLVLLQSALVKTDGGPIERPQGDLVASASVTGTLARPTVVANAHTENGILAGIEFQTLQVDATYKDNHLVATLAGQQKSGGRLLVTSDVKNLVPKPTTTTRVEASNWDLGFLKTVLPQRAVGGLLSAKIDVLGPLEKPSIVGTATLKDGSVHPGAPLYTLRNLDVNLVLTPAKLKITGTGESGRGEVSFEGLAAMADLQPQSMRLDLKLRRLPVQAGPLSIFVDSKTVVRGKPKGADWRFDVDVGDTLVTVPGETTRTVHPDVLPADIVFVDSLSTPPPALAAALASTPASVIDVYIRAPETISVRGEPVRTTVDVDLHARLARNLILEGTVETRGGWLELFGRRYELRRGNVGFGGSPDPALDIALTHDFSAMTLTIAVTGTGSEPQLALRSEPSRYDDSELLSFVLGASPDDDRSQEQTAAGRATGAASSFLAGKMQAVVRNVVPIDVLKIDVADDEAAAEKLTVGKWLTEKIFVAYRRRFEAQDLENANEAVIEYRFRRRWLLELSYGDQGTGGADVLWLKRF